MSKPLQVGAHAAWHLDFRTGPGEAAEKVRAFGSSDYYASIDATLPAGLDGGSYTFVVEGMASEHYADLYRAMATGILVARLHLYWRDAGITGYFVDLAGLTDALQGDEPPAFTLVAVLRVTGLKRRAGTRRYEVVIEAREWVYDRVLQRIKNGGKRADPLNAAAAIAQDPGIGVDFTPLGLIPRPPDADTQALLEWGFAAGDVALDRLTRLDEAMQAMSKCFGLGMYLIRHGSLFAGPGRLVMGDRYELASNPVGPDPGLLEVQSRGQESVDPNFIFDPAQPKRQEPKRDLFELTLRGRPDIMPGDFVTFTRPAEETVDSLPASFAIDALAEVAPGAQALMYVRGVTHRLARDQGFVTVLRGVSVPDDDPDKAWFEHSPPKDRTAAAPRASDDSPEGSLTGTLHDLIERGGGQRIDVAQVRAAHVRDSRLPNQTEEVRRGLVPGDAKYAAARLAFEDKEMHPFETAPYASPFAWGPFGLVLPRYPGMRVLVAHRLGESDDIVDVGALWDRGQAPASEPGDYWLILPAAVAPGDREQVAGDQKPKSPSGKATNDLIDADGNRVIEVGKLTVRIGADKLASGGSRPAAATDPVHIEHTSSGSKIAIDQNGNITIDCKRALNISAVGDITLDSQANVVVKVASHMQVRGR